MNSNLPESETQSVRVVEVNRIDKWQVYQRLQALQISCHCAIDRPLQVEVADIGTAIQLWSVVRQFTASRSELIDWLNRCWYREINLQEQ